MNSFAWMSLLIPETAEDLLGWQAAFAILYGIVSALLHLHRKVLLDLAIIFKAVASGGSLPAFFVLIAIPFRPSAINLLSGTSSKLYLCIAGLMLTLLSIQSLFTGPRKVIPPAISALPTSSSSESVPNS